MAINFFDCPKKFPSKKILKKNIGLTTALHRRKVGALNYIFVSDDALLEINKTHLKHDYYTDIITFDLGESEDLVEGDIYISTDRVADNAAQMNVDIAEEYLRVAGHGLLHLLGFKDKTSNDVLAMRKAEGDFISRFYQLQKEQGR